MGGSAPSSDIVAAMRTFGGLDRILASGAFPDLADDTVCAIMEEVRRFADEELAPLDRVGDQAGASLNNGVVTTAPGWREAYRRWTHAGWNGIGSPSAWGGQDLPVLVQMGIQEFWNAANPAFAVGPMLSTGAVHALVAHASDDLKQRYLPKIVSGEWMVTMNLTEPQAGSDLGALTTRAERAVDGGYRIFGQKIFITYGEHDLTDNIVHLVLARLPDAPAGTKGISMFVVPKVLPDGTRNDLIAAGLEHKLGMHGSPTCTMVFGDAGKGATGWLVGSENRGLACMFTMMNHARLSVGIQGVGVAARACDQALAYARARRQGRAPGSIGNGASPIVEHPDIQRQLLQMMSLTAAARAICYACAEALDMSRVEPGRAQAWVDRASLLTPIAKAFCSDAAIAVTSSAIQVYGGAGYIEESGVAQGFRDARIFAIYEGTNGIQAIDLVTRKLALGDGAVVSAVIDEIGRIADAVATANHADFGATAQRLAEGKAHLGEATAYLLGAARNGDKRAALAGATPYLQLFGLAFGGALLANGALAAGDGGKSEALALARFFAETRLGETGSLAAVVTRGSEGLEQAVRHLGIVSSPP